MAGSGDQRVFRYALDANDRVVSVADPWLEFARENDAPHLTREAVVGRSVWDFLTDGRTRHLYEQLFERARSYGQVLCVPFRCDSPEVRRFMELDIIGARDGGLTIESRLLCEERRAPVRLRRSPDTQGEPPVQMCGWCKRVRTEDAWVEVEEAIDATLPESERSLDISHVTCPDCYGRARAQLGLDC